MKLIKLGDCHSTQEELKVQLSKETREFQELAVTSSHQVQGKGQRQSSWHHFTDSLAVSFTFKPQKTLSLNSLLVGVIVCDYFKSEFNIDLKLKWPNDILNNNFEKVGGVIIDVINSTTLAVGLGVNLYKDSTDELFDYPHGFVLEEEKFEIQSLLKFFWKYDKIKDEEVIKRWNKYCAHLSKLVVFENEGQENEVIFQGIGKNGEAILDSMSPQYNGSIRIKTNKAID